jgi:hypothetical protein
MSSERDSFAKGIFSTFAKGFLLHKLLLKVNYLPLRVKKSRSHDMGQCHFHHAYSILHHCHAALPGSFARQPCPAALPGSLARQPCTAALPGSLARQPCPAALPGSLARQPCPAPLKYTNLATGQRPAELSFFTAVGRHAALLTFTVRPAV